MRVRLAVVAQRAIVSQEMTSSLIDVIDEMSLDSRKFPPGESVRTMPGSYYFVVIFESQSKEEATSGSLPARFSLETPAGTMVDEPMLVDFEGKRKCRVEMRINGLPFGGFGSYVFKLTCGDIVASWDLDLTDSSLLPS